MALLSAEEIYTAARHAGFSPDQAVTMTAIALAESSGHTDAHNPNGEDSWGLWQINLGVHTNLKDMGDQTDPLTNAQMAYEVSGGGENIKPWTVTHADKGARYLQYQAEAERAAQALEPEHDPQGMWNPPLNYHAEVVGAGQSDDVAAPSLNGALLAPGNEYLANAASQVGYQTLNPSLESFLSNAEAQDGDEYIFGIETQNSDQNPAAFDCSELVQWAAAQAGVEMVDGSWLQYQQVRDAGGEMTIEEALNTPGALLFRFGSDPNGSGRPNGAHVAISLGDGRTIEARGRSYGVGYFDADDRGWTHAGSIAEFQPVDQPPLVTGPVELGADSDGDSILDRVELALGTDPFDADTDKDGFIDSVELLEYGTDPLDAADNARELALNRNTEMSVASDDLVDRSVNVLGEPESTFTPTPPSIQVNPDPPISPQTEVETETSVGVNVEDDPVVQVEDDTDIDIGDLDDGDDGFDADGLTDEFDHVGEIGDGTDP